MAALLGLTNRRGWLRHSTLPRDDLAPNPLAPFFSTLLMAPPPLYDIEAFRKSLRRGPRRGYLFGGKEPYLQMLALDALKAHYGTGRYEVHFQPEKGESLPLGSLLAELVSPGLFGEPKLVILLDAAPLLEKKPRALFEALAGKGPGTVAVQAAGRLPTSVTNAFKQHGEVHTTRKLYENPGAWVKNPTPAQSELAQWVVLRARQRKKQLQPADAWELIQRVGAELFELDQGVEQLALSAEGAAITAEQVRAAVGHHRHYQVFELADAVMTRDRAAALRQVRRTLIEQAEDPVKLLLVLLNILRNSLGQLLQALELRRRPTPELLKSELGIANKWAADRLLARLQRFRDPAEVLRLLRVLYEADRDFKQGRAGPGWLIERVVLGFCR